MGDVRRKPFGEEDLLVMLRSGNGKAVEILFSTYHRHLVNLARKFTGSKDTADEIVVDLLLTIWNRRHILRIQSPLMPYLIRATINRSRNYLRRETRLSFSDVSDENLVSTNVLPHALLEHAELRQFLEHVIDNMPAKYRKLFLLHRCSELTYQQIADHMGISVKTVEKRMSLALRYLRERLKRYRDHE